MQTFESVYAAHETMPGDIFNDDPQYKEMLNEVCNAIQLCIVLKPTRFAP